MQVEVNTSPPIELRNSLNKRRMRRRIERAIPAPADNHLCLPARPAACSREVDPPLCVLCFLTALVRPAPVAHFDILCRSKKSQWTIGSPGQDAIC